ncbi:UNVERIFIED_CONTAM: preprotein translocase subunit YajC [Prevotella sp. 15_C9]
MNTAILLAAQSAGGSQSPLPMILMMVAIFVIMWLFMIRPQQKKQKQIRAFQNALKEGDSVVTGGGIYGTVKRIDMTSNKIDVEIARGVTITVDKGYVFADTQALQQSTGK